MTEGDAGGGHEGTRQLLVSTTDPERVERRLHQRRGPDSRAGAEPPHVAPSDRATTRDQSPVWRVCGRPAVRLRLDSHRAGWQNRNIVTRAVPILGAVPANRRCPAAGRARFAASRARAPTSWTGRLRRMLCPATHSGLGSLSLHAWAWRSTSMPLPIAARRLASGPQARRAMRRPDSPGRTLADRPDTMHFRAPSVMPVG